MFFSVPATVCVDLGMLVQDVIGVSLDLMVTPIVGPAPVVQRAVPTQIRVREIVYAR